MKKFVFVSTFLIWLIMIVPVAASDVTEGRIAEHSVVSFVGLTGLLALAHLARKNRNKEDNISAVTD